MDRSVHPPAAAMDERTRWADLPPDLVREISGHIQAAADLVRFHAVCKPWRDSRRCHPLSSPGTITQAQLLLPWLLAPPPPADSKDPLIRFRCVFSKSSYRALPPPALQVPGGPRMKNWVAANDGTAVRYLTVDRRRPILTDPLSVSSAADYHLPLFPEEEDRGCGNWPWDEHQDPHGVVYSDGAVFLYGISPHADGDTSVRFTAALFRPGGGDARWTVVRRTLATPAWHKAFCFCAAYHRGKILVTVDARQWRVVVSPDDADDVLVRMPRPWDYSRQYSYALESRGELLWASVHVGVYHTYHKGELREHHASVSVYALSESDDSPPAPEKKKKQLRWVLQDDGESLADRVLFLGYPNSFAADASRLGIGGGCAYLLYHGRAKGLPGSRHQAGVFRYDFADDGAEIVERLTTGWAGKRFFTWLVPRQPAIASMVGMERHHEPCFRVVVRGLPLTVKSSQLRLFFGGHGRVSEAEVLRYRKTKASQGIGLVTIATPHSNQEDAVDALDGLLLDGIRLRVSLAKPKDGKQR